MKRHVLFLVFLSCFSTLSSRLIAQEAPTAAGERLDAEDRRRMTTDIEDLKAAVQSLQLRLNEQRDEIRKLSEELARAANNKDFATREDLKHLVDKIKEVDDKRLADNKNVVETVRGEFARLGKTLATPVKPAPIATVPDKTITEAKPPATEKGFEYTIRSGDNPKVICQALATRGVKVTQKQVLEANPNVNWTKLRIGQKIFIPAAVGPDPERLFNASGVR